MTATTRGVPDDQFDHLVERAAAEGFQLVQFETSQGQLVWEWRCGDDPRPQFVSRRVALNFMEDWLRRNTPAHRRRRTWRHARR
jgi:hypothetical protein